VSHDLIFDFLTAEDCVVIGLLSHAACRLLDRHLQSRRSLVFTKYDMGGLLPRALAHCRKLARLDIHGRSSLNSEKRIDAVFAKLITQNAATFQGLFFGREAFLRDNIRDRECFAVLFFVARIRRFQQVGDLPAADGSTILVKFRPRF